MVRYFIHPPTVQAGKGEVHRAMPIKDLVVLNPDRMANLPDLEQFLCMSHGGGAGGAEHAHQFGDSGISAHLFQSGDGTVMAQSFGDEVMVPGEGCHLREMGDGDDLVSMPQFPHFHTDGAGDRKSVV